MKRVVMFSGGVGSWAAAKRVSERHGVDGMVLLFTDTMTEDEDLYRFIDEAAADIGAPLVKIADGRNIWELFRAERFLGNSRIAPCTTKLKRDVADRWLRENCDPAATVCYVGIDWTEAHRFDGTPTRKGLKRAKAEAGWTFDAPMCEAPFVAKWQMLRDLDRAGITPPPHVCRGLRAQQLRRNVRQGRDRALGARVAVAPRIFPGRRARGGVDAGHAWEAGDDPYGDSRGCGLAASAVRASAAPDVRRSGRHVRARRVRVLYRRGRSLIPRVGVPTVSRLDEQRRKSAAE